MLASALKAQRAEITEFHVYRRLSRATRKPENQAILKQISDDELKHYAFWRRITHRSVTPNRFKMWFHYVIARVFGLTFAMKLMEEGEGQAQIAYGELVGEIPGLAEVINDEDHHEAMLVELVDEDHFNYVGSIMKGLNAAVVELVGALAGLTLVFHDNHLIALAGMVVGIAMTMSLVGTDFLGSRADRLFKEKKEDSFRKFLTGPAYSGSTSLAVAFILTVPFLTFANKYVSLGVTVGLAVMAIFTFNFYVSVTRNVSFFARVREIGRAHV